VNAVTELSSLLLY